jgi:hypothetical protein
MHAFLRIMNSGYLYYACYVHLDREETHVSVLHNFRGSHSGFLSFLDHNLPFL